METDQDESDDDPANKTKDQNQVVIGGAPSHVSDASNKQGPSYGGGNSFQQSSSLMDENFRRYEAELKV